MLNKPARYGIKSWVACDARSSYAWKMPLHSVTYNIAKHVANILAPLVSKTPHHIQNSIDFVNKVQGAMGSPVSPIVAHLYMEEVEHKALNSFRGTAQSHWFRYVDDI